MTNERTPLLAAKHLEIAFGQGKREFVAVKDASFDIYRGGDLGTGR